MLITAVTVDAVTAAPVTAEAINGFADTFLLPDGDTSFGVPVTVWAGLLRDLPASVLDRPVDEVGAAVVGRTVAHAARVPEVGSLWADQDAIEARAALADDLAGFGARRTGR